MGTITTSIRTDAQLKRGLPKDELRAVIEALANDKPLPERCRPHMLSGNWSGHRGCHIRAGWLLVYKLRFEHQLEGPHFAAARL